jgi:hypothetical protein
MRQSMPSSNIDSCAGVRETRPVSVTGHWKWVFLKPFAEQAEALPVEPKQFDQPTPVEAIRFRMEHRPPA